MKQKYQNSENISHIVLSYAITITYYTPTIIIWKMLIFTWHFSQVLTEDYKLVIENFVTSLLLVSQQKFIIKTVFTLNVDYFWIKTNLFSDIRRINCDLKKLYYCLIKQTPFGFIFFGTFMSCITPSPTYLLTYLLNIVTFRINGWNWRTFAWYFVQFNIQQCSWCRASKYAKINI